MEKPHFEVDQRRAAVCHGEVAIVGEMADRRRLDILAAAQRQKRIERGGRYRQHHSLLCLRHPDLPRLQPSVLEPHIR